MDHRCTYGPVPSRRLGLSLGVDLIPYKICCYDCLYCQVGRTTDLTTARRDFIEPDRVAREVEEALRGGRAAECVTLSGSGEPTLHRGLGEVAAALRRVTTLPLVLLTNGGLLWDEEVADAARLFDVVAPTLTAAEPEAFTRINRPHPQITHDRMLAGLRAFCRTFTGRLRLEVLLVGGVNDSVEALRALVDAAASLGDIQVDLNTVVRPPAYPEARPVSRDDLEAARSLFEEAGCSVSVVAAPPRGEGNDSSSPAAARRLVLETIARRPCTLEDLSSALGITAVAVSAVVDQARLDGEIDDEEREGRCYYRARCLTPSTSK